MTAFELIVGMVERGHAVHVSMLRGGSGPVKKEFGVVVHVERKIGSRTLSDNRLIVPDQSCKADMDALYADMLRQMEEGIRHRATEIGG